MQFVLKQLLQLSIQELFEVYKLRNNVFVVEQNCAYQDVDDKDQKAYHVLLLSDEGVLFGYSRILPPGVSYQQPSIGRVAIAKNHRGKKLGAGLMKYSISKTLELFDGQSIAISAQEYLTGFYTQLGFKTVGGVYDEDGIPHIKMVYTVSDLASS